MSAPTPLSDPRAAPLLIGLRDCLRDQLAATVNGRACRTMIVHSAGAPVMDGCACECEDGQGDAWVRLVRLDPNDATLGTCDDSWQAVVELGVYRCVPVSEDGGPLDEEQVTEPALEALSDMYALLRVYDCCAALRDTDKGVDYWLPVGPAGGCGGGILQFRVGLPGYPIPC